MDRYLNALLFLSLLLTGGLLIAAARASFKVVDTERQPADRAPLNVWRVREAARHTFVALGMAGITALGAALLLL